jgi:hypothetical protein
MRSDEATDGRRVHGLTRRDGVCTGRVETGRAYPQSEPRAEVRWPDGATRWPLVSALTPAGG